MNNKTLAIVSYITIIGWLVSFFSSNSPRDPLVKYHQKQSFGLYVIAIAYNVIVQIVARIIPSLASILSLVSLVFLILIIIGAINASKEKETPLPLIGKIFENKFGFIN
ncbi:DUF4870 domain-containing protein [Flavobacterium ginsengiterrae]|uniref:Import component protein n=1 Tax=Flavobacterium ginsengiterrae TaxID=871695 RepID=A0ABP7GJ94_9FLAO